MPESSTALTVPEEGAPDDPKKYELDPKGDMSFMEHLGVLRNHIFRSILWYCIGIAIAFFTVDRAWELMLQPLCNVEPTSCYVYPRDLMEPFWVYIKLGALEALFFSSPALILEMWSFVAPGLYKHEKRMIVPTSIIFGFLFAAGAVFGFKVVFPPAFQFLLSTGSWGKYRMMITMSKYFSLCATLLLSFGVIFELPLVMAGLSWLGLVKPRWFTRYRRLMWFAMLFFAAAVTPTTDPITMMLMGGPMVVLYEIGIIASKFLYKPRLWADEAPDPEADPEAGP